MTDRVLERIKPALQRAGVDLPFPTTQALLHDQTETADGDRSRRCEGWPARRHGEDPAPRRRVVRDGAEDRPEAEPTLAAPRGGGRDAGGPPR